jgi:hypothetical protein
MALQDSILSALSVLATILGSVLLVVIFLSIIIILIVILLLAYSFKTGNILFPNQMILGIIFFEGPIKAVMRLFGVDDTVIDKISIDLQNRAMRKAFNKIPYDKRAIFIPQCLRSVDCPARLSPEGIKCKDCGSCEITKARQAAEKLGYSFFIVPGSSFIFRMIKKYHPKAIIGVGCMAEVKEGLDLMHKNNVPAIGVVLDRSGCVETQMDWKKFYEVMQAHE